MAMAVGMGVVVHSPTPDEIRALLAEYNRDAARGGEFDEVMSDEEIETEVARRWSGGELVLDLTPFAELADGRRVVARKRDGHQSLVLRALGPDRVWTEAEVERCAREWLFDDDSPRERWVLLRPALRRAWIFTRSRRLDALPFSVELTAGLRARLAG